MDKDQNKVFKAILSGHNIVLLGQAGTGKTFTIKESVAHLRARGSNVSLCCFTGIACLQYRGMGAMTLHQFAGLEDGRHFSDKLAHLIMTDERFASTKSRILETDTLVIDEVSMVSKKIFESVEYICRHVRGKDSCFGGMQVILSGDFYQLKPVPDELYGDSGHYCFDSEMFQEVFPHIISLKIVHRQTDIPLIQCVNELEIGSPSDQTHSYLKSLSRPLPAEFQSKTVKLFARNIDVDMYNYEQAQSIEGTFKIYNAVDYGDSHFLNKLIVPKKLALKKAVKVMLLKNLSDKLVNGLVGTITELSDDFIEVDFDINGTSRVARLFRYSFSRFDPVMNTCIARRFQFPVRLAYAITIHKSQGMSILYLEINCKNATNPGQIGVAVGRAVSSEGLRVINYSPSLVKQHSYKVSNFYKEVNDLGYLRDDLTCCQAKYEGQLQAEIITDYYSDSDLEDFERALNNLNTSENHRVSVTLDHTYYEKGFSVSSDHTYCSNTAFLEAESIFKKALQDYLDTSQEVAAKSAYDQMLNDKNEVTEWYQTQHTNIYNIYKQCCISLPGSLKQKHFTDFHTSFNRYIHSDEYLNESQNLLKVPFSSQLLTSVLFLIQCNILSVESQSVQTEHSQLSVLPDVSSDVSPAGRGKIRYVGGYCIAKCRYRLCNSMKSCLFTPGMEHEIKNLKVQINILDRMTVTASEIMSTTIYRDTLEETSIKQNICESLVNISDQVYDFFVSLEITSRKLMTYEILVKEPKYMFRYIINILLADSDLFRCFVKNCCTDQGTEEHVSVDEGTAVTETCEFLTQACVSILLLYEKIVRLFTAVAFSQFRKDYTRVLKREKGKALRKKVLEKKSKTDHAILPINTIQTDESPGKTVSHLKLKAVAIQNHLFYTNYKKVELIQLLKAYGQRYSSKSTKLQLGEQLYNYLVNEDSLIMSNPELVTVSSIHIENEQPEPSSASTSSVSHDVAEPEPSTSCPPCKKAKLSVPPSVLSKSSDLKGRKKKATGKAPRKKKTSTVTVQNTSKKVQEVRSDEEIDEDNDLCAICSKKEKADEFWISCDSCCLWFHRECVGLEDEDDWTYFSGSGSIYICPLCQ